MRVLVWGTFDLLHAGHRQFLQEAAKLGELYVVVVPDEVVLVNKGYFPVQSADERRAAIAALPFVANCFIDSMDDGLRSMLQIKPNLLCLGYDQKTVWEGRLEQFLRNKGYSIEVKWLDCYANGIHTSDIRQRQDMQQPRVPSNPGGDFPTRHGDHLRQIASRGYVGDYAGIDGEKAPKSVRTLLAISTLLAIQRRLVAGVLLKMLQARSEARRSIRKRR